MVGGIADEFDPDAMVRRFRDRASAVRERGIPPVEGPERRRFVEQARLDYQDYAMIGDAVASLDGGVLTLTIDLRPREAADDPSAGGSRDPDAGGPAGSA